MRCASQPRHRHVKNMLKYEDFDDDYDDDDYDDDYNEEDYLVPAPLCSRKLKARQAHCRPRVPKRMVMRYPGLSPPTSESKTNHERSRPCSR